MNQDFDDEVRRNDEEWDHFAKSGLIAQFRAPQLMSTDQDVIAELIQNADDARSHDLELIWHDKGILVWNNGDPFTPDGVTALRHIHHSPKAREQRTTGRFGIGIQSVYRWTETIYLFSTPKGDRPEPRQWWQFDHLSRKTTLDQLESGDIPPREILRSLAQPLSDTSSLPPDLLPAISPGRVVFWLPFRANVAESFTAAQLFESARGLERALLFTQSLRSLTCCTADGTQRVTWARDHVGPLFEGHVLRLQEVTQEPEGVVRKSQRWWIGSVNTNPKDEPAGLVPAMALMLNEADQFQRAETSPYVFVTLPTAEDCGSLGFCVHALFHPDQGRSRVNWDAAHLPEHHRLIDQLSQRLTALVRHLGHIRHRDALISLLLALPTMEDAVDDRWRALVEPTWAILQTEPFLPTEAGDWQERQSLRWTRDGLSPIIPRDWLQRLTGDPVADWIDDRLARGRGVAVCRQLSMAEWTGRAFAQSVAHYTENHPEWIFEAAPKYLARWYAWFATHPEVHEILRDSPILRMQSGQARAPGDATERCWPGTIDSKGRLAPLAPFLEYLDPSVATLMDARAQEALKQNQWVRVGGESDRNILQAYLERVYGSAEGVPRHEMQALLAALVNWKTRWQGEWDLVRSTAAQYAFLSSATPSEREKGQWVRRKPDHCYLGAVFTRQHELENWFGPQEVAWVNPIYVQNVSDDERKDIVACLVDLGAARYPRVIPVSGLVTWKPRSEWWRKELSVRGLQVEESARAHPEQSLRDETLEGFDSVWKAVLERQDVGPRSPHHRLMALFARVLKSNPHDKDVQTLRKTFLEGGTGLYYYTPPRSYYVRSKTFRGVWWVHQLHEQAWVPDGQGHYHRPNELVLPIMHGAVPDFPVLHPDLDRPDYRDVWSTLQMRTGNRAQDIQGAIQALANESADKPPVDTLSDLYALAEGLAPDARSEVVKWLFTSSHVWVPWRHQGFWAPGQACLWMVPENPPPSLDTSPYCRSRQATQFLRRVTDFNHSGDAWTPRRIRAWLEALANSAITILTEEQVTDLKALYRHLSHDEWWNRKLLRCWAGWIPETAEWRLSRPDELLWVDRPLWDEVIRDVPVWREDLFGAALAERLAIPRLSQRPLVVRPSGNQGEPPEAVQQQFQRLWPDWAALRIYNGLRPTLRVTDRVTVEIDYQGVQHAWTVPGGLLDGILWIQRPDDPLLWPEVIGHALALVANDRNSREFIKDFWDADPEKWKAYKRLWEKRQRQGMLLSHPTEEVESSAGEELGERVTTEESPQTSTTSREDISTSTGTEENTARSDDTSLPATAGIPWDPAYPNKTRGDKGLDSPKFHGTENPQDRADEDQNGYNTDDSDETRDIPSSNDDKSRTLVDRPSGSGRRRTYVGSKSHSLSRRQQAPDISAIDEAGMRAVIEYERQQGRHVYRLEHNHPGYDLTAYDPITGEERWIEVKSTAGDWRTTGIAVSATQFRTAQAQGPKFWLYVVEHAIDQPQIWPIRNPANQVDEYYFDDGWRQVAEENSPEDRPDTE